MVAVCSKASLRMWVSKPVWTQWKFQMGSWESTAWAIGQDHAGTCPHHPSKAFKTPCEEHLAWVDSGRGREHPQENAGFTANCIGSRLSVGSFRKDDDNSNLWQRV